MYKEYSYFLWLKGYLLGFKQYEEMFLFLGELSMRYMQKKKQILWPWIN